MASTHHTQLTTRDARSSRPRARYRQAPRSIHYDTPGIAAPPRADASLRSSWQLLLRRSLYLVNKYLTCPQLWLQNPAVTLVELRKRYGPSARDIARRLRIRHRQTVENWFKRERIPDVWQMRIKLGIDAMGRKL